MSRAFSAISLDRLPAPTVVEEVRYEAILAAMLADLRARDPVFSALVESDPAYKIIEVAAYREMLLRQRINHAAKQTMLAYATGSNLDQIGARFGVARRTGEGDESFRAQIQLAFEGYTTAGSEGSYVFHTLRSSLLVKDVHVTSPVPGDVDVYVLSTESDGYPSGALLDTVEDALTAEDVRPLTDRVFVKPAEIVHFEVEAVLHIKTGPDPTVVHNTAMSSLTEYMTSVHQMGGIAALSGIYEALHQPGVRYVELIHPTESIVCAAHQAPYCTGFSVSWEATSNG